MPMERGISMARVLVRLPVLHRLASLSIFTSHHGSAILNQLVHLSLCDDAGTSGLLSHLDGAI